MKFMHFSRPHFLQNSTKSPKSNHNIQLFHGRESLFINLFISPPPTLGPLFHSPPLHRSQFLSALQLSHGDTTQLLLPSIIAQIPAFFVSSTVRSSSLIKITHPTCLAFYSVSSLFVFHHPSSELSSWEFSLTLAFGF